MGWEGGLYIYIKQLQAGESSGSLADVGCAQSYRDGDEIWGRTLDEYVVVGVAIFDRQAYCLEVEGGMRKLFTLVLILNHHCVEQCQRSRRQ